MKLEDAKKIVDELQQCDRLGRHIFHGQVCGSIRRKKEFVKDVDWVIIPKAEAVYGFGDESLNTTVTRLHQGDNQELKLGNLIKTFRYKGIMIELYIADDSTFETLMLIRTGSTEHNIRLTKLARSKGLKLFASGKGLCKIKDGIDNGPDVITEIVEDTERGILQNLLGRIPEPEERRN